MKKKFPSSGRWVTYTCHFAVDFFFNLIKWKTWSIYYQIKAKFYKYNSQDIVYTLGATFDK